VLPVSEVAEMPFYGNVVYENLKGWDSSRMHEAFLPALGQGWDFFVFYF